MELSIADTLFHALKGPAACFIYSGAFHDSHTARLIELGETLARSEKGERVGRSRAAFIMVEAYQNIIRHSARKPLVEDPYADRSVFILCTDRTSQQVIAMNPVETEEVEELERMMVELKSKDPNQLKEMFLYGLQRNRTSRKGGAGLGLIEMARRADGDLRYDLHKTGENMFAFTLDVGLGKMPDRLSIQTARSIRAIVAKEDVLVAYSGPPKAEVLDRILKIVSADLDDMSERAEARVKGFLALTQFLEEMGSHVPAGIMLVFGKNGRGMYASVLGMSLDSATADVLDPQVKELAASSTADIHARYRDALRKRASGAPSTEIGLLEMAHYSKEPLQVLHTKGTDGRAFLTIAATV